MLVIVWQVRIEEDVAGAKPELTPGDGPLGIRISRNAKRAAIDQLEHVRIEQHVLLPAHPAPELCIRRPATY